MPKCELLNNISLHVQKLKFYQVDDHVGEKTLSSDLLLKFRPGKKPHPTSFPNCLLESHVWIKSMFPYALLLHHERAKWDTIG